MTSQELAAKPRGFTIEAAASYLHMSVSYVRKRVYDGTLPARKLGSRVIVLREDLDKLLESAPRA